MESDNYITSDELLEKLKDILILPEGITSISINLERGCLATAYVTRLAMEEGAVKLADDNFYITDEHIALIKK